MWTWRTLGYDRVSELQAHLLSILGCRCRTIEDGGAGAPSPGRASQSTWTSFGGTKDALASSGSEVLLNEQGGPIELEMLGAAAGATPSAWRVTNFGTLRVCIPGAVAVEQGPAPAVFPDPLVVDTAAFAEGQVQQRGGVARQQTASDGGLQSALATLLQLGGGTCYYQVPCVDVHLRDDIATECCAETAAPGYTQCVVGVVLGAVLKLKLSIAAGLPGKGDGSPTQLPHVPGTPDPEGVQHVVTGDGFQLRIVQTGGPPLDPAKMSSHTTEGVAKELYTWAKKAASKLPTSWRTLYVCCRPGQAESLSRSFSGRTAEQYSQQHGRTAGLGVAFRGGRQLGDILLVASADAELKLEPFELTYGTAHLNSLRRMFEDEIATALGIPSEQVLCGEFLPYGGRGAPRKRHLRRETVTLQFCFLSPELAKLARPPSSTEPSPSAGAAAKNRLQDGNPVSPASPGKMSSLMRTSTSQSLQASGRMAMFPLKRDASSNLASTETSMQLAATLMSTPALSNTLQNVDGVRKTLAMTLSQNPKKADTGDAGALIPEAVKSRKTMLGKSISEPFLGKTVDLVPQLQPGKLPSVEKKQNEDLPPDQLLKALIGVLANGKHPIRKHADCFPVLARIVRGGVSAGPVMVVGKEDVVSSKSGKAFDIIDSLKALLKAQRPERHNETEFDADAFQSLSKMRSDILQIYNGPDGELLAAKKKLQDLSAKDLLEKAEEYYGQPKALVAVLETVSDKSAKDADSCLRLRKHNVVERLMSMAQRFSSNRGVVYRCILILDNMTLNDVGAIDRILEKKLAPDLIGTLSTFFEDEPMQVCGCKLLRRLYIRTREQAQHGPRMITLGNGVDELHTFRGLDHVYATMHRFKDESNIQLECLSLLVSLGEMLYNNGLANKTFELVSTAMHRYSHRADILAQGILIITRLGKGFLTQRPHGPKGMLEIVNAMARHRSVVELQRVGTKALFALCKHEEALMVCRNGGGIDAVVSAMSAHSKDPQVLQQGTRALEKLCPRALAKTIRICGDLALVLPPVSWSTDPMDAMSGLPPLVVGETGFSQQMLDSMKDDLAGKKRLPGDEAGGEEAEDKGERCGLAAIAGYRSHGLREDLDGEDTFWAVPGSPKLNLPTANNPQDILQKDIAGLKKSGCDETALLAPGPNPDQVKSLCEALGEGAGAKQYGPHDAEFLAVVLGHFAWHSAAKAHEVITYGGAKALITWLRWPKERQQNGTGSQQDDHLNFAMVRACLAAVSSICRHDEECAFAVLSMDGANLALDYVGHLESTVRRAALRCLARMIPHANKRGLEHQRISSERAWPCILKDLRDKNEAVRTAASACALEAAFGGWVSEFKNEEEVQIPVGEFADAVFGAFGRAGQTGTASAALPLLLAVEHVVAGEESDGLALDNDRLHRLKEILPVWLPKGTAQEASAADRAAALVAAALLWALSERPGLLGAAELEALLRHGGSCHAEPVFRDTCDNALGIVVARTTDAEMLAQLVRKRMEEADASEERFLGMKALQEILRRIVQLLKQSSEQAMDTVLIELDRAEPLIPKNTKETYALLMLLREARLIAKEGLSGGGGGGDETLSESARTHTTSTSAKDGHAAALGQTGVLNNTADELGGTGNLRSSFGKRTM